MGKRKSMSDDAMMAMMDFGEESDEEQPKNTTKKY